MVLPVLSCLTLRPSLSPHHPPSFHPSSCSGFLTLRFLLPAAPGLLHTRGPPLTPCYPPHPPAPQGKSTACSPFVLPSSSSLLHLCLQRLCVREASKGSEEREAAEEEEEAGARNQTRADPSCLDCACLVQLLSSVW